jgi:hypothetical protein
MYMKLRQAVLVVLLAGIGVLGFIYLKHDAGTPNAKIAAAAADPRPATAPVVPEIASAPLAESPAPVTDDDVTRWSADAAGGDAGKRAAAITALAQAPVAQALPVLRRVLMNGEPSVDRPLALQSLRDLALNRGDPESAIRNAIREAIYHGDDQTMAADAQEALDVIEESLLN